MYEYACMRVCPQKIVYQKGVQAKKSLNYEIVKIRYNKGREKRYAKFIAAKNIFMCKILLMINVIFFLL